MQWTGITRYDFYKLVENRKLLPVRIRKHGHPYYRKDDVKKLLTQNTRGENNE